MPSEFTVRSDSVDVEQIMGRIRARVREKRGVDYTEDEIRELADVKIEAFLDPTRVRSDLLEHYLEHHKAAEAGAGPSRGGLTGKLVAGVRLLLSPLLKLVGKLSSIRHALRELRLNFVLIHNLVVEITRLSIEVRNLKMRVESLSSRLDFNERRARALENVVQYRPGAVPGAVPARATGAPAPESRREPDQTEGQAKGEAQRRRRRRRRGRGDAGGTGRLPSESGGQDGVESAPGAAQQAPTPAAVPDRDTPDQ